MEQLYVQKYRLGLEGASVGRSSYCASRTAQVQPQSPLWEDRAHSESSYDLCVHFMACTHFTLPIPQTFTQINFFRKENIEQNAYMKWLFIYFLIHLSCHWGLKLSPCTCQAIAECSLTKVMVPSLPHLLSPSPPSPFSLLFFFMIQMINYIYTVNKYQQSTQIQNQPPAPGLRNSWITSLGCLSGRAWWHVCNTHGSGQWLHDQCSG